MKRIILVFSTWLSIGANASTPPSLVNAKPSKATIYLQGAFVTRAHTGQIKKGIQRITFIGLPQHIEQNKIFAGTNSTDVKIVSISKVAAKLTAAMHSVIKKQTDSVESINNSMRLIKLHRSAYTNEYSLINENRTVSGTAGLNALELEKVANVYRRKLRELADLINAEDVKIDRLTKQSKMINQRLSSNYQNFQRTKSAVELTIMSNKKTTTTISLKYFIRNAGWSPNYNFRFNGLEKPCNFEANATISNNSTDHWDDISVTLSTAQPVKKLAPDQFQSWIVNQGFKGRKKSAYMYDISSNQLSNRNQAKNTFKDAFTNEVNNEITETYELNYPITLTKKTRTTHVEIKSIRTQPSFKHIVNLGSCDDTYLTANIVGWQKWRLLSGPVNVYNHGELNGSTQFKTYQLNDTMQIPLGIDRNVVVKYRTLKDAKEKSFLSSNYNHTFHFEISVKNNNGGAIDLEMIDQVPVSINEKITVEVTEFSGAEYIKKIGKITWKVNIPNNKGLKKQLKFIAKYPKSQSFNINGYRNRRF